MELPSVPLSTLRSVPGMWWRRRWLVVVVWEWVCWLFFCFLCLVVFGGCFLVRCSVFSGLVLGSAHLPRTSQLPPFIRPCALAAVEQERKSARSSERPMGMPTHGAAYLGESQSQSEVAAGPQNQNAKTPNPATAGRRSQRQRAAKRCPGSARPRPWYWYWYLDGDRD